MNDQHQQRSDQISTGLSRVMRIKAGLLAIVTVVIAALSWLVMHLLSAMASDQGVEMSTFVSWWMEHPPMIALLAVPAVLCAVAGATVRRFSWALISAVVLLSLIPVAVVLYCFLQVLAPMYQYQTL